jgi:hypothetical protein
VTTGPAGGCLCGAVGLRLTLPSKWVAHCHCTLCQRAHGAPFVTWAGFDAAQVAIADPDGCLRWYRSSAHGERAHCGRCGTPLLFRSPRWPGELHVARACIPAPLDREPEAHVHWASRVAWLDWHDDLPRVAGDGAA